jgi:Cupin-like domain
MSTRESTWTAAPAGLAAAGAPPPQRLHFDSPTVQRDYNRRPFAFQHDLHREPALRMEALHALALRLDPKHVRHSSAHIPVTADFMHADRDHPTGLTLAYTMEHMDTAGSYVLIANPQTDARFGRFFNELVAEIHREVGSRDPGFHDLIGYIFISSPGATTPYHLDREINFLCQVRGHKVVHLFDPFDRQLLSEAELDKVLFQPHAPRPPYREAFEGTATQWPLAPGCGVHHPYMAPHWVANGSEVSISLAITYRTKATARQVGARSFNHLMRRAGITPRPFGPSPLVDALKASSFGVVEPLRPWAGRLARLLRR